jgi:cytochrome c
MTSRLSYLLSLMFAASVLSSASLAQDAGDGQRLFQQRCASCHALQSGQNRLGPHLAGILGRRAGSVEGARYSGAIQGSDIVWDEPTLDSFLTDPRQVVPGTTMVVGVPNSDQRRAIIAYLRSVVGQGG